MLVEGKRSEGTGGVDVVLFSNILLEDIMDALWLSRTLHVI